MTSEVGNCLKVKDCYEFNTIETNFLKNVINFAPFFNFFTNIYYKIPK